MEQTEKDENGKRRARIALIRDVRFFFNTLDRALSLLDEAGFQTVQQKRETENGFEIRQFVPKQVQKI